ncbi:hypothetical protein L9F63_000596, partial [Diploptera punctata]
DHFHFLCLILDFPFGLYRLSRPVITFLEGETSELNHKLKPAHFSLSWVMILVTVFSAPLTLVFLLVVYLPKSHDIKFMFLVLLFVISIMILIISQNIIRTLIGWDRLG